MNKEEKCKELLEKVKQAPNNVIEGAIDSLHTEYIKEAKEYIEYEIKKQYINKMVIQIFMYFKQKWNYY